MKMTQKTKKAPRIAVRNTTRRRIPEIRSIRTAVRKIFEFERRSPSGLGITYVSDKKLRRLSRKFLGRDSNTDVMAFGLREGRRIEGDCEWLGDIVISIDAAVRQARSFGSTRTRELKLYLIHGVLHLLGYDDRTEAQARRMRKRQEWLLRRM